LIVNGIVGLHATGGSTNHTLHLVAMAAAAGIAITWQDISDLSDIVPLLARVYPNGLADVNHFNAAGGMGFLIRELLGAGLLHADVRTVWGEGLRHYTVEAKLGSDGSSNACLRRRSAATQRCCGPPPRRSSRPAASGADRQSRPRHHQDSAVKPERRLIEAPARFFKPAGTH
jgi:phosphogluconate dehydratase